MIEEKSMVALTDISQSKSVDMIKVVEMAQGSGPMVQQGLGARRSEI
jgi:hypothetical protein